MYPRLVNLGLSANRKFLLPRENFAFSVALGCRLNTCSISILASLFYSTFSVLLNLPRASDVYTMVHRTDNSLQAAAAGESFIAFKREDQSVGNSNREDIWGYVADLQTRSWLNRCPSEMKAVYSPVTDVDAHGLNGNRLAFGKVSARF